MLATALQLHVNIVKCSASSVSGLNISCISLQHTPNMTSTCIGPVPTKRRLSAGCVSLQYESISLIAQHGAMGTCAHRIDISHA